MADKALLGGGIQGAPYRTDDDTSSPVAAAAAAGGGGNASAPVTPAKPAKSAGDMAYQNVLDVPVEPRHRTTSLPDEADYNAMDDNMSQATSVDDSTLESRHRKLNRMFGMKPWYSRVTHKPLHKRSNSIRNLHRPLTQVELEKMQEKLGAAGGDGDGADPESDAARLERRRKRAVAGATVGNAVYVAFVGIWMALFYAVLALVLALCLCWPHARRALMLAEYYLWPFGKYVEQVRESDQQKELAWNEMLGKGVWALLVVPAVLVHVVFAMLMWFFVIYIPMAKVLFRGIRLLANPLTLNVEHHGPSGRHEILLFAYGAVNKTYYRHTIFGLNVVWVNLLPLAPATILLRYVTPTSWVESHEVFLFVLGLVSTIPLAYTIGTAVSRIAAQTSFSIGAALNATFSSIIEVVFYTLSIKKGFDELVRQAITGSLLAMLLLLPGLSMIAGGIKHKEQTFNKHAAGVSSVLLIVALVGTFVPTFLFNLYEERNFVCGQCTEISKNLGLACTQCGSVPATESSLVTNVIQPLSLVLAVILPLCYLVGLLFTTRTHAHLLEEEGAGEEFPSEWSKTYCIAIMIGAVVIFGVVAEVITDVMKPALAALGMTQSFAGLTIITLVTSMAELLNAIVFAVNNDLSLSMEVTSSTATQTAFIEVPAVIIVTRIVGLSSFHLVFNLVSTVSVIFAVVIFNYISIDGKANYFEGYSLVTLYTLMIAAFYYLPENPIQG